MDHISQFQRYIPVDEGTAKNFSTGAGPAPPERNYRLYFGEGWRQAPWNHAVINNMVQPILMQATKERMEPNLTEDAIKAVIWDFVLQSQNSWNAKKPRIHENGDRLETREEASARDEQYKLSREHAVRSTGRKKQVSFAMTLPRVLCFSDTFL